MNSDRQNFADTNAYVRHMLEIREKLANTADDFKFTDRLFAWILIHGYRNTDRHMENDVTRGAKTPQESKYIPWPTCAPCGGQKHPPKAHRCGDCNCFHTRSNSCAPKCEKKCGAEFHYLSCKAKSRFMRSRSGKPLRRSTKQ